MTEQLKNMGCSYDWRRRITTCHPSYYRWNQWFFLKLYEKGLAYRAESPINWCPSCRTVLANEQVIEGGHCWRCGSEVTKRKLEQWFFATTKYAQELLDSLDDLPGWPENVKIMQRNWIGRSEGVRLKFEVPELEETLETFTTRGRYHIWSDLYRPFSGASFGVKDHGLEPPQDAVGSFVKGHKHERHICALARDGEGRRFTGFTR